MTTRAPGSSVGVDQIPSASVYLEPTRAGFCVRVGTDVLASGGWESAEAAVVKAAHVVAVARKAETSHTGVPPKNPGSPGVAWPLPIVSVATLIADLEQAMTEHAAAAKVWWHDHGVEVQDGESPWLLALSDVHVPTTRGRSVGEVRSLQGLGSSAFLLGALTRQPPGVVIAVPDAGDRHLPKHGGTGRLQDYWPKALRGIAAKAKAPHGRHAWTVGGDAASAYVETYGTVLPSRTLTGPVVMPARSQVADGDVDTDAYTPAGPVAAKPPAARSKPAVPVPGDARTYLAALHKHVTGSLAAGAGTTYLADVLRACAIAVTTIPAPDGVDQLGADELAFVLITRAGVAKNLNTGDPQLRSAIKALAG